MTITSKTERRDDRDVTISVRESETSSTFTINAFVGFYGSKTWSKATVNWSACGSVPADKALAFASALAYCGHVAELLDAELAAAEAKKNLKGCACSTSREPNCPVHGDEKCAACVTEARGGNACTQHGGV